VVTGRRAAVTGRRAADADAHVVKILILGGTLFVGRHLVEAALARGHEVTLFNRGREAPDLYPGVERIEGDRRSDLAPLRGRRWDAAIDTAAYVPSVVERAASLLAPSIDHYTFISTRSVYADHADSGEGGRLSTLTDEALREAEAIRPEGRSHAMLYGPSYGALKALCERAAEEAMPGRVLVVRPGLIVGPFDPTDRFTYWVRRVARGGAVLAPGRPDRVVRALDARDLAAWCVRQIEARATGVFNTAGADGVTMEGMLDACRRASGSDARFVWASEALLVAEGVTPWSELPLWVLEEDNAFLETGNARAVAAGLAFRSLEETAGDTLSWDRGRGDAPLRAGLAAEREAEILAKIAT
jgi:2'-hydroxyisoflavone reductase